MPLTTLDPTTALIVIDLQQGHAAAPTVDSLGAVVARANDLLDAFHRYELPVVLVVVAGTPPGRTEEGPRMRQLPEGFTDLMPDLHRQPGDHVVTKYARSAFSGTGLADWLRQRHVTQVVVTGVSTSGGVESTGRDAHEQGFHVTFALDAMSDAKPDAQDYSVNRIFPRIGETGTTQEIVALLETTRP